MLVWLAIITCNNAAFIADASSHSSDFGISLQDNMKRVQMSVV